MKSDPITLVMEEIDNSGKYDAHVDDRYLLTSPQPFLDGARALLDQGYDPGRRLLMCRAGREQIDLAAPLGHAAGLRVSTPIFAPSQKASPGTAEAPLVSQKPRFNNNERRAGAPL
jgi:hypothetical protein